MGTRHCAPHCNFISTFVLSSSDLRYLSVTLYANNGISASRVLPRTDFIRLRVAFIAIGKLAISSVLLQIFIICLRCVCLNRRECDGGGRRVKVRRLLMRSEDEKSKRPVGGGGGGGGADSGQNNFFLRFFCGCHYLVRLLLLLLKSMVRMAAHGELLLNYPQWWWWWWWNSWGRFW